MSKPSLRHALTVVLLCALPALQASADQAATPLRVELPAAGTGASGRLLINLQPAELAEKSARDGVVRSVAMSPFGGVTGTLIGMDVDWLAPGQPLAVDDAAQSYPTALSALPAGEYYIQAVLDTARDNNYGGSSDDISSKPVKITLGGGRGLPLLVLDQRSPAPGDVWDLPAEMPEAVRAQYAAAKPHVRAIDQVSGKLSAFWGRPIHMRGWVVLPPGYETSNARYPVVYWTHGFGGDIRHAFHTAVSYWNGMAKGGLPPMIWVMLDESSATGTHEFADSVNNGPWGAALTEELIPRIDRDYRTDGTAASRFVTGHSSGGWAALWLQVRYPKLFGGSWPTAPDSGDFRDFTGADLYAPNANVYRRADGTTIPLVRMNGKVVASFEQFAKIEAVTGPYGGQMASFEWVFSPRGADGRPMPLFDRRTGAVDPAVASYWRDHYDISHIITRDWNTLKPDLDGKIHLIIGTADTFYLDGGARRLEAAMRTVGAKTGFRFVPGRSHFDLGTVGEDRRALTRIIAWEMYKTARPEAVMPANLPKLELEPGH
ncbi:alpha/beta hydrolase-fold protein [Thermomonas sp.]|uniref:alpha/beta hydrolase n=1 Tax=Thermomonas sp. TaxID=1971895 RepID=UPI00262C08D9|nr:alpha/beta hydrolase-fold protein [Thermomonas sp.]